MNQSCLYAGNVMHHRMKPRRHRFIYRVTSMLVDLDELPSLAERLKLFSLNRFNLFSFHERDHGDGSDRPLVEQVRETLSQQGFDLGKGRVELLCYPRILGYVFNPLSVFYCYNEDDQLAAILYEVSNTFNQKHNYLIPVLDGYSGQIRQSCDKEFYVSPFISMATRYHFRMQPPANQVAVCIRQTDAEGPVLHATFTGQRRELNDRSLLRTFFGYPLMTLKVIAGIHWEALQIWRKKVPLQPRPAPPVHRTTLVLDQGNKRHETV
ncbi:DUF1365 domain-containing protein [Marinobacterium sediminicola]|uniref:DUF1365 domain-containing protein n=1 Tax=Marinobacterium sediminicola TaxID=518898 RepID=A0ABY1S3D7_9GAMM|nr:DUF1365 domain-containing protein [Marinobacterium sediminicola]ULG68244.1 DUF1365 domain-containing protein [Marinobacterium sediminicola]SMR77786.1 hypothetical protein SAMN04487964_11739 [Marinobacterium sediminicola]